MRKEPELKRFFTSTTEGEDTVLYWHDKGPLFVAGIMLGIFLVIGFVKTFIDHTAPGYMFFGLVIFTVVLLTFLWFRNYWRIRVNKQSLTLYRGLTALSGVGGRRFSIAKIGTITSRTARGPADDNESLEVVVMQLRNRKKIRIGSRLAREEALALLQELRPFVSTGGALAEYKFSVSAILLAEMAVMIVAGLLMSVGSSEYSDRINSPAMKVAAGAVGYVFMFVMISQQEKYVGKRVVLFMAGFAAISVILYLLYLR
jgi:hypothetical protein